MNNQSKTKTHHFIKRCFKEERISGPVLEVGSGKDRFNRILFSRKYAVTTCNIYPKNVVDRIASVTALPFQNAEFGCVICEHVLEHVEEPARAISEILRVLKPGGLLILVVPFSWPIHEKPYDLWRFSEEGVRQLLGRRFEAVSCQAVDGIPLKPKLLCVTARKPSRKRNINHPKVSVIMPTYNRAHMIRRSIKSILAQTFKDWELVIVSDGSTDNTKDVVESFRDRRIRFFRKDNAGCASARNYGIKRSRGEYIAYCDDDDQLMPFHLEVLCNYLDRHPELAMARGKAIIQKQGEKNAYLGMGFLWALAHRSSALRKTGFFDDNLMMSEDLDFILRMSDHYPSKILDYIFIKHTDHKNSITESKKDLIPIFLDLVFAKRIRHIFANEKIGKEYFLILAYMLSSNCPKATLALAKLFSAQHPGKASAVLIHAANYLNMPGLKRADKTKKLNQIFSDLITPKILNLKLKNIKKISDRIFLPGMPPELKVL